VVRRRSKGPRGPLLLLLLLERGLQFREFRNNRVLHNGKAYRVHKYPRRGPPSTWSNYSQILDRRVLNLLRTRQLRSSKYSRGRGRLTVPKSKRGGRYRLPQYSMILRCFRRRSKVRVRTKFNAVRRGETNSFGKYSYCRTFAFEYGDR
jgi:hypothetical protein